MTGYWQVNGRQDVPCSSQMSCGLNVPQHFGFSTRSYCHGSSTLSSITEQKLIDLVIEWVKQNHKLSVPSSEIEISGDTDLLASGLIDSFGFVDLILQIESIDELRVDLTDADPIEFTVVKGLCRIALRSLSPAR